MRFASTPEEAIQILDDAFNEGNLDVIMAFYDDAAVVVPQPGVEVRGKGEIRAMFADMLKGGMQARQLKVRVLEADGIALFISRWKLSLKGQEERNFISTTVLRRQTDGCWKAFIDNAQGPANFGMLRSFFRRMRTRPRAAMSPCSPDTLYPATGSGRRGKDRKSRRYSMRGHICSPSDSWKAAGNRILGNG
jgi:ketosteroid isomerase-like protein